MLKALNNFGACWLTRVFQVAWKTGEIPKQLQTNVLIPVHKKEDKKKMHYNYRGISLLSLLGKIYAKGREIVKPQLQDAQCAFCSGRSTMDHCRSASL